MTRTQFYTATTLDGFIATPDDSLDWLFTRAQDSGGALNYAGFIAEVGALAMGSTTYEWILGHEFPGGDLTGGKWPYEQPCWVFTHRELPRIPGIGLSFVQGEVRPVYDEIVAARPGANIWVVGGGDLVGQFDDARLLDEIWLGLTPVVLGAGAPLLPRRITSERLRFRTVERSGQRVRVVLDVSR